MDQNRLVEKPGNRSAQVEAAALIAILIATAGVAPTAQAQLNFVTSAGAAYEHNSNIFLIPAASLTPAPYFGTQHASPTETYTGDLISTYQWSEQKLGIELQGRKLNFDNFSDLNHDEYKIRGDLDLASGSTVEAKIGAVRERHQVPFTEVVTSQLLLETESRGKAGLVIPIYSRWRLEADAAIKQDDSPRPGSPDLRLNESSGKLGVKYNEHGDVFLGLTSEYLKGHFSGVGTGIANVAPGSEVDYHQLQTAIVAERKTSKTDSMHAEVGYTTRSQNPDTGTLHLVTGDLSYLREITGKTAIDLGVSREANVYITSTGAVIDNTAHAGVQWHATGKATVKILQRWVRSKYPDWYGAIATPTSTTLYSGERDDTARETRFEIEFAPIPQIIIRPYVRLDDRDSNFVEFRYNATVYGIEIRGQVP